MNVVNECKAELIHETGTDLTVVNAARVSFDKESEWERAGKLEEEVLSERDKKLINYLAKHGHWTPFAHNRFIFDRSVFFSEADYEEALESENIRTGLVIVGDSVCHSLYGWARLHQLGFLHNTVAKALHRHCPVSWSALCGKPNQNIRWMGAEILPAVDGDDPRLIDVSVRETVPIFVARQRFKHMVGFTYNEVSRRYVADDPEFFVPDEWRGKPENAKQGSSDSTVTDIKGASYSVNDGVNELLNHSITLYNDMLNSHVSPEQARMVLPQNMMTSYYVTGSLAAWARAYHQRIDSHAQKEIQELAKTWDTILSMKYPKTWTELKEGRLLV